MILHKTVIQIRSLSNFYSGFDSTHRSLLIASRLSRKSDFFKEIESLKKATAAAGGLSIDGGRLKVVRMRVNNFLWI